MLAGIFIVPNGDYLKAAGAMAGFYTGYLIEPRYIRYKVRTALPLQVFKMAAGPDLLLFLKISLDPLLSGYLLGDFCRYLVMGTWITVAAPALFMFLGNE